ncbi:MAG: hypothetical protein AB4041_08305 [Microcystaceae cyanobacterium]
MKFSEGEIYLISPTLFIKENVDQLLPSWSNYPTTLIIILYFSNKLISSDILEVEREKKRLKNDFLQKGYQLRRKGLEQKALMEMIDPQDGYPINSGKGAISFDIVAIIHEQLGFKVNQKNGCKCLNHPLYQNAIYPCLLLTNALDKDLEFLILNRLEFGQCLNNPDFNP